MLAITVLERTRVSVGKKVIGYEGVGVVKKESPLGEGPSVLANYPVESAGLSASVVQSLDWFLQGKISFEAARDQLAQSVAEQPETSVAMMKLLAFAHQGEHLNDDDYQFLVAAVDNARVQEQPTQSYYHGSAAESSNVVELSTRAPVLTPQDADQPGPKRWRCAEKPVCHRRACQ